MKAHELAKKLLEGPDLPVYVQSDAWYDCSYMSDAEFIKVQNYTNQEKVITITQTNREDL